MSQLEDTKEQVEVIRQETLGLLDTLAAKAKAFELPESPPALEEHRRKLVENSYKVLVVGEAKRGKSTFINALIGRDVLPTNVQVATSQVFYVHQAEREAYRICFEDDSMQEIIAADLPKYGSQVVADTEGTPSLNQIIRWIEVDLPIRFLPDNVSILDTPGLGSLYAPHAQITHRFVPHADAVIFVLDSEKPIIETEVKFVDTLLSVTQNIFFIQTKIDAYNEEDWREIQRRNQKILQERFGDRLVDTRVWPISSEHLRSAAQTGDEVFVWLSGQEELSAALQAFLARVAGWSRAAEAILVAEHYHTTASSTLGGRLATLTEESKQKREEIQRFAAQRKQQWEAEWGPRGQKTTELVGSIKNTVRLGKQSFKDALQPRGEIERALTVKINELQSLDEANRFGEALSGKVAAAAIDRWVEIYEAVQAQCIRQLTPFLEAAESMSTIAAPNKPAITVKKLLPIEFKNDIWGRLKAARMEAFAAGMFASVLAYTPLAPLAAIGVIGAMVFGWRSVGQRQLNDARQRLRQHLADVLQQVREHFFNVDLSSGNLMDECFNTFEYKMVEQVQALARQKSQEAQAEIARLSEAVKLDEEQRKAKAEQLRQQVAEWEGLGRTIQAIAADLKALDQSLARAPAPTA